MGAQHRFGCRILQRLAEHCCSSPDTLALIWEILNDFGSLSCHDFGNYVIRSILEHGLDEHRHWIAVVLKFYVFFYANNKFGSFVLNSALELCSKSDREDLIMCLHANEDTLKEMAT